MNLRQELRTVPDTGLASVRSGDDVFNIVVTNRPDELPREQQVGYPLYVPNRELLSIVTKSGIDTYPKVRRMITDIGQQLTHAVISDCTDEGCKAKMDIFEKTIPEIGAVVLAAGVVCHKSCTNCPLGLRSSL